MEDREKLLKLLREVCPDVDFVHEQDLIGDGLLESLELVTVAAEMIDAFGVKISVDDMLPENFRSLDAMLAMIRRKKR